MLMNNELFDICQSCNGPRFALFAFGIGICRAYRLRVWPGQIWTWSTAATVGSGQRESVLKTDTVTHFSSTCSFIRVQLESQREMSQDLIEFIKSQSAPVYIVKFLVQMNHGFQKKKKKIRDNNRITSSVSSVNCNQPLLSLLSNGAPFSAKRFQFENSRTRNRLAATYYTFKKSSGNEGLK